jgi:hypothetical protein
LERAMSILNCWQQRDLRRTLTGELQVRFW